MRFSSYLSPKAEVRLTPEKNGNGVFALEPIARGELIAVWGGEMMGYEQLAELAPDIRPLSIQVEEDLYLVSTYPSPADFINHCCDPNAWIEGQIVLRARREIAPGEELCFDYATCDGSPYDEFICGCSSPICRGRISGDDWQIPALQERYAGHFMPYLQRRIEEFVREKV